MVKPSSANPTAKELAQRVAEELWARHVEAPSAETEEALVVHYEPLARYLARRALAKAPAYQDREDILSYAHHGLLDALSRFEPGRGLKFETYATRRIAGAIIDGQRKQDPLTRSARRQVKEMAAIRERLELELEREPSIEELAEALGVEPIVVRQLVLTQMSLNASLDDLLEVHHGQPDGGNDVIGGLASGSGTELGVEMDELRSLLSHRLPRLGARELRFVHLYYCEYHTLREVAQILGMHESRAGQIRTEIMRALATV